MAILSISELPTNRRAEAEGVANTTQRRHWLIRTDSTSDDATTLFLQAGAGELPQFLDPLPSNPNLLCRALRIDVYAPPYLWTAEAEYSTIPLPQSVQHIQLFANPLERPARVSGGFQDARTVPQQGYFVADDGTPGTTLVPILNSAGDHFDSLPEIPDPYLAVHIAKNYNPLPEWIWTHNNATNDAPCTLYGKTFDRGELRTANMRWGEPQQEQGVWYWTVEFDVLSKRSFRQQTFDGSGNPLPGTGPELGWWYTLADRGFNYIASGVRKKILLGDDSAPTTPQLLDGSGGILANPQTATAVYRTWVVLPEVDFSVLPEIPMPPVPGG